MRNYYNTGRRDANETEIKDYLNRCCIPFISLYPKQGADILIFLEGAIALVEVKSPFATSSRKLGTDVEKKYQSICKGKNIPYFVVKSSDELHEEITNYLSKSLASDFSMAFTRYSSRRGM